MSDHEHVAVFWDYENCSPSCNMTGYDIVNNIREIAHTYGSVTQFKAYLELSEQSTKSTILRSELQSCGVSLTDCPHNGRKEVADKMMIVDMLTYALDTPAPATIVLITGDRDFVYAVSVLRLRLYRVVLVAPQQAHNSLKSQATAVLDWSTDVLGKEKPTGLPTPGESSRSAHKRSQSSANSAILPASPLAAKSQRRLSFGLPLVQRPGIEPLQGASNFKSPRAPSTPLQEAWTPADDCMPDSARSQSGLLRPQVLQNAIPTPPSQPTPSKLALKTTIDDADIGDPGADMADLNLHLKNLTNRSSSNNSPSLHISVTPVEDTVTEERSWNQPMGTDPRSSTLVQVDTATDAQAHFEPSERTHHQASLSPEDVKQFFRGNDVQPQASAYNVRIPVKPSPSTPPGEGVTAPALEHLQAGNDLLRPVSASVSVASTWESSDVEYRSSVDGDAVAGLDITLPADTSVQSGGQPVSASEATLTQGPPIPTPADEVHTMLTALSTPPGASSLPLPGDSYKPDSEIALAFSWLPSHFANLVRVMQELHANSPKPELLRSSVAVSLSQRHKGEYKQAGYTDFKAFSTAAEQRGLVVLGGSQGTAWMKLDPVWFDCL